MPTDLANDVTPAMEEAAVAVGSLAGATGGEPQGEINDVNDALLGNNQDVVDALTGLTWKQ